MRSADAVPLAAAHDAEVIRRSRREPACFAIVFDRHAPPIRRYLARRVGPQFADDLLAETFLVAFAKRRVYDPTFHDARPWLYGIATRLVSQHRREELRRHGMRGVLPPDCSLSDHAERVIAEVTAHSIRAALTSAIAGLADGDRDVLLLVGREELSYDEAARALEIPVGTVRSRMHRARAHLRRALSADEQAATYEEILSNE